MNKNDCFYLGVITKPQGLKGNVSVYLDVDTPEDYRNLESVFVEFNNSLVPFFIEFLQLKNRQQALIKFEGIDTIDQATELVKSQLWLPLAALPPLTGNKFYYHEVKGYQVIDKHKGNIGIIIEILEYPNNVLLQIAQKKKEILIPVRDEVILSIDRPGKTIHIEAPEGLIDIYLADQHDPEDRDDN